MPVNLNAIKATFNRLNARGGQGGLFDNMISMPEGEGVVTVRFMPPAEGLEVPFEQTRIHKLNGRNYHCPCELDPVENRWVGNCPACNYVRHLWKISNTAPSDEAERLQNEARDIKAKERFYWNAIERRPIDRNGNTENIGPKIYPCGTQVQNKILLDWQGDPKFRKPPLGDITDHQTGYDFNIVKRLGTGYPNYSASEFLKSPSVSGMPDEIEQWMANLHDLRALRKLVPYEELAKQVRIHRGLEKDPDCDFDGGAVAEFQDNPPRPAPIPSRVSAPEPPRPAVKPIVKPAPAPAVDEDEALADEDFLARLRSMG